MNSAAAITRPDRAIAGMLAVLRVMVERFIAAFGAPAALAAGGAVYGKTRERVLRFLHDMECVVRRLLLLRAALFPAPPARASAPPRQYGARRIKEGDAQSLFGPGDDPALWRVSFRMATPPEPQWMFGGFRAHEDQYDLGHRTEGGANTDANRGCALIWVDDPRPLAERFEALRRIIDDPDHYAARLAQRLYAWRGRDERRQLFLYALGAKAPFANEAGLSDEELQPYAEARPMAQALIPVFSEPLAPPKAGTIRAGP